MPVASQFGIMIGNHYHVEGSRRDGLVTARTQVLLTRLVGLDRDDGHVERIAHAIAPMVTSTASATMTKSSAVFSCSRKGLKPMPRR